MPAKTRQVSLWALLVIVGTGRVISSFDKIPPDPGLDRMRETMQSGVSSLLSRNLGYFDVSARIAPLIASHFSVSEWAVVLSATSIILYSSIAFLVSRIVAVETGSEMTSIFCGLIFVTIPAAAESTVGNHGSLKWPLLALLCLSLSSERFLTAHPKLVGVLALLTGLSNPFSIVALLPMLARRDGFINAMKSSSRTVIYFVTLTFVAQVSAWYSIGRGSRIYGMPVYGPWPGMGLFWLWLWLGPLSIAAAIVTLHLFFNRASRSIIESYAAKIALVTVVLWMFAYLDVGIKDSVAVATQSLALIALVLVITSVGTRSTMFKIISFGIYLCIILSAIWWYPSSAYLQGAGQWSTIAKTVGSSCATDPNFETTNPEGQTEVSCAEILSWG